MELFMSHSSTVRVAPETSDGKKENHTGFTVFMSILGSAAVFFALGAWVSHSTWQRQLEDHPEIAIPRAYAAKIAAQAVESDRNNTPVKYVRLESAPDGYEFVTTPPAFQQKGEVTFAIRKEGKDKQPLLITFQNDPEQEICLGTSKFGEITKTAFVRKHKLKGIVEVLVSAEVDIPAYYAIGQVIEIDRAYYMVTPYDKSNVLDHMF